MAKPKSRSKSPKKRTPPPVVVSKPRPWGLIISTVLVVAFAGVVIGYALIQNANAPSDDPRDRAEAAAEIEGIQVKEFPSGQHVDTAVVYEDLPPFGGQHDGAWADCSGTVYDEPIRSENAVHSMEHGAVWITYRPDLTEDEVDSLRDRVDGEDHIMMSPFPELSDKVAIQTWGYQLFVSSVDDERIDEFIRTLRANPATTPEPNGSCSNPAFAENPRPYEPQVVNPDPAPSTEPSTEPSTSSGATSGAPSNG